MYFFFSLEGAIAVIGEENIYSLDQSVGLSVEGAETFFGGNSAGRVFREWALVRPLLNHSSKLYILSVWSRTSAPKLNFKTGECTIRSI